MHMKLTENARQESSDSDVPGSDLVWSIVCTSARHRSVVVALGAAGFSSHCC
jgi:hypothetical protein